MTKSIKETYSYYPPKDNAKREDNVREIIVVQTTDDVRYIFNHVTVKDRTDKVVDDILEFSHRWYPDREKGKKRVHTNYRLPQSVEEYIKNEYGMFSYMSGMIPEALSVKQSIQSASVGFQESEDPNTA